MRESYKNIAFTECVTAPTVGVLDILLKTLSDKELPNHLRKFLDKYKNDTSLVEMELCNLDMEKNIRVELSFFKKCRPQFFRASSDRYSLRNSFYKRGHGMHSTFLFRTWVETRSNTNMRELKTHT